LQYLLVLAELSSQGGDVDESRQRTKSFVLFLFKFVFLDSPTKRLKPLLTAMGLSIPECVNTKSKMEAWRYKTNATEALVSNLVTCP
jgi:hypothetical protein